MKSHLKYAKRAASFMVCLCVFLFMTGLSFAADEPASKDLSKKQIEIYEKALKEAMDQVFSVIESIEKNDNLSLEEKKQQVVKFLKVVRYGPEKKDYFSLIDTQAKMIMDPYQPDLVGKDMTDFKDPNGKEVFIEILKVIKEKGAGGYVQYLWPRYEGKLPVPKVSLVRIFKPFNEIVITGLYLDTIEAFESKPEWAKLRLKDSEFDPPKSRSKVK